MHRPTPRERIVNGIIRAILRILCRIDDSEVSRLPLQGPYLLAVNHINFLDIPILYLFLLPRKVTGLVKKETWERPLHGFLGNLWRAIPVRRGVVDKEAMRRCVNYLRDGGVLFIAPEGTRSGDGVLRRGKGGIVTLALEAGVPVYPVAHYGGEGFWSNVKHMRRTDFTIRVGEPFYIRPGENGITSGVRRRIADQVMYRIAELLPYRYRGVYADGERDEVFFQAISDDPSGEVSAG